MTQRTEYEEAVDAAARSFFNDTREDHLPYAWNDDEKGVVVDDETKGAYRVAVRGPVVAAAPIIAKQAVEEFVERLQGEAAHKAFSDAFELERKTAKMMGRRDFCWHFGMRAAITTARKEEQGDGA